jgi:outer membrane receptor for ferrienterochelin and colicins
MEHSTIRASYSRGFRAPSLKELYLYFVDVNHNIQGNENLKAEDSHNFLVTMGYNNDKGKANFGLDLDLFYNTINNIISIAQVSGDLYSYINIDNYTSQGFQAELFYDHYPEFKWTIGVAHTGRKNVIEGESDNLKGFLYSTDINSSFTYRFKKIATEVSAFYKYTGRLPQYYQNAEGSYEEGYIDDYNNMDITVKKSLLKNQLQVSAGVKNIFDVTTIYSSGGGSFGSVHGGSSSSLVGYGRTFFAGLSYTFNRF